MDEREAMAELNNFLEANPPISFLGDENFDVNLAHALGMPVDSQVSNFSYFLEEWKLTFSLCPDCRSYHH